MARKKTIASIEAEMEKVKNELKKNDFHRNLEFPQSAPT